MIFVDYFQGNLEHGFPFFAIIVALLVFIMCCWLYCKYCDFRSALCKVEYNQIRRKREQMQRQLQNDLIGRIPERPYERPTSGYLKK